MSFGNNLRNERIKNSLSQENLAELIGVSRQAVSVWESDNGYPEVEKLLEISKKLNVSLDYLFYGDIKNTERNISSDGKITIFSPTENVTVRCSNIKPSQQYKGKSNEPKFALFAFGNSSSSMFSSQSNTVIGWYASRKDLSAETAEISKAIAEGRNFYTLKYSVKVQRKGLRLEITD